MWYIKGNKSFLFFFKSQCNVLAWVYTQRRRLLRLFVNKIKCCPKRKTEDGLNRDKRWKGGKHNVPKANFSMSFQALKERGSWRGLNGYVKEESRIIMHRGDVKVAQECRCYYHWKASPETKAKTSPRGNLEKGKINWRVFFLSHFPCLSVKLNEDNHRSAGLTKAGWDVILTWQLHIAHRTQVSDYQSEFLPFISISLFEEGESRQLLFGSSSSYCRVYRANDGRKRKRPQTLPTVFVLLLPKIWFWLALM